MATTVYSGSGAITHTNSSGGNQRILIYWLKTLNGSATMTIGSMSVNMSENQVFGLKLAINTYVNNNSSMTNTMTVTGGDGTGNGSEIPLECYIAEGQTFSITGATVDTYNFIVIDE